MIAKTRLLNKAGGSGPPTAMPARMLAGGVTLPCCKEPCVRAAGADPQPHAPGALRAIAFVGGRIAIDIGSGVHVTADEVHADEAALRCFRLLSRDVGAIAR